MIVTSANLHEYFREALSSAVRATAVNVTDHAQAYLVHLLSDFSRSERVFAGTDHGSKPALALLLSRAQDADKEEALTIFKHMGDSALYLLGFFSESSECQLVGPDYYVGMGEAAYGCAARLVRDQALSNAALFGELSDRFGDLVEVLSIIRLYGMEIAKNDLPAERVFLLVEQFQKTRDPNILRLLRAQGIEKGLESAQKTKAG